MTRSSRGREQRTRLLKRKILHDQSVFTSRAFSEPETVKRELVILIKPTVVKMDSDWADDIAATGQRIQSMNERGQGRKPE